MDSPVNSNRLKESMASGRNDSVNSKRKDSMAVGQRWLNARENSISGLLNHDKNLENSMTKNALNFTMTRRVEQKPNKRDLDALDLVYSDTNKDF